MELNHTLFKIVFVRAVACLIVSEFQSFRSKKIKPQKPQISQMTQILIYEIICEICEICGRFSLINSQMWEAQLLSHVN